MAELPVLGVLAINQTKSSVDSRRVFRERGLEVREIVWGKCKVRERSGLWFQLTSLTLPSIYLRSILVIKRTKIPTTHRVLLPASCCMLEPCTILKGFEVYRRGNIVDAN